MFQSRRLACLVGAALLNVALWAGSALATDIQQEFTFSGSNLTVINMIGQVEVVPSTGEDFTVRVSVEGSDAVEGLLTFDQQEAKKPRLLVQFPLDEYKDYVYPELGRNGRATITYGEDEPREESWLKRIIAGVTCKRVTVRGRGKGLEVWADITIGVPAGGKLKVIDRVGEIVAKGIEGDLDLDTSQGAIRAMDIRGDLVADTGSGAVEVARVQGEVLVDTGSGSVSVELVRGPNVDVDTGSGSVELKKITAARVRVDTGSGGVNIDEVESKKLSVDTGSGGVRAEGISTDGALIDTGSGSVDLVLVRMGSDRFEVDTGSGSINFVMPRNASAHIGAETSSGGIRCRIEGAKILHKERNEMEIVIGSGEARVTLDAGSGTITVAER